jgi:ParB-like chromosome segregation protein Spo0J
MPEPMVNRINPKNLKHHPLNATIYGDAPPDQEFLESCEDGIIEHLHITKDMVVISGNRRLMAALALGQEVVPVLIRYDLVEPLEIERALILANAQRKKTKEMIAKEYRELKRILTGLALTRKKATQFGTQNTPETDTENEEGSTVLSNVTHHRKT